MYKLNSPALQPTASCRAQAAKVAPFQRGITLIETMIALLVFGLAMLGLAGLQAAAVNSQTGVWARSAVTAAVVDISERMRANFDAVNGVVNASNIPATGYVYAQTFAQQTAAAPSLTRDCLAVTCTTAERATFDVESWRRNVRAAMPNGSVLITGTARNGFDVTVMWTDKSFTNSVAQADDVNVDNLGSSEVCPNAPDPATQRELLRFCCPAAAAAPAGVRCYNARVIP